MTDLIVGVEAVAVALSFAFSIYTYVSTRRLLKPFERPLLVILGAKPCQRGDLIGYALEIKNTGQRPATNIRFRRRAAPESDLNAVVGLGEWAPAHDYQPGGEMELTIWPERSFSEITLMQVAVSYSDGLSSKSYDGESYWLVIHPDTDNALAGMSQQQRQSAEQAWKDNWGNPQVVVSLPKKQLG